MGIRGLTKYIEANDCYEEYHLHDTNLVIEGKSVLCQLFQIYSPQKKKCFGGDYDKFADYVDEFFEMLSACKVIPYVVFEGGTSNQKMEKTLERLSNGIEKLDYVDYKSLESSYDYLPICIYEVFQSVVLKRNIKTVRCDLDECTAILSIAHVLRCPVLSFNSDYFMCSHILFIPGMSIINSERKINFQNSRETDIKFIKCSIFKADKFLQILGLTDNKLPLLASILQIDFINFPRFYLWPIRIKFDTRIMKIAQWIKKRSVETAVNDIINHVSSEKRDFLKTKLQRGMRNYKCGQSKYLVNLGLSNNPDLPENEEDSENNNLVKKIPKAFLENYRKCRYSSSLMDIFIHNKYFSFKAQVENISSPHSHILSERIVSAIQKILINSDRQLECFMREGDRFISKTIPRFTVDVPSFADIAEMNNADRRLTILKILGLDFLTEKILEVFPKSWQLFMVTLLYIQKFSPLSWSLCYSLVLCKAILHKFQGGVRLIRFCEKTSTQDYKRNFDNETIQTVIEMGNFFEYFQISSNPKSFDIDCVHAMSKFQSCLLHIIILNDLLNMPFTNLLVSDCFNGTFIYNFSKVLEEKSDMDEFIQMSLLKESPTLISTFQSLVQDLKNIEIKKLT